LLTAKNATRFIWVTLPLARLAQKKEVFFNEFLFYFIIIINNWLYLERASSYKMWHNSIIELDKQSQIHVTHNLAYFVSILTERIDTLNWVLNKISFLRNRSNFISNFISDLSGAFFLVN